jgi:hypothetical protein
VATVSEERKQSERARVGQILADRRQKERLVWIDPSSRDEARYLRCVADPLDFLKTYFPDKFSNPWTDIQREMVAEVIHRMKSGGDQALAGPRGCAKTTCTEGAIIYGIFAGLIHFPLIIAATGPDATRIIDNIKYAIETSDTLLADYPATCGAIRALEGAPQRASMQECCLGKRIGRDERGKPVWQPLEGCEPYRSEIEWSADRVVFPIAPGELSAGAVLMARGMDGSIRGLNVYGSRPDFVLLDDIDTAESAGSLHLTEKRERAVERDVAGLAGPGKSISRVMLCTPQNRRCLAYKYTDPKQKPSWNGKRYRLLNEWPTNREAWEVDYSSERIKNQEEGDSLAAGATALYESRREEMDAGAVVTDPLRYTHGEVSALQHCFNIICDRGLDAFLTEYQCDPPEEEGPQESGITDLLIVSRKHLYPHRTAPADGKLSLGVDVGDHRFYWTATASDTTSAEFIIDYGFEEDASDLDIEIRKLPQEHPLRQAAVEKRIYRRLVNFREFVLSNPFKNASGAIQESGIVLIDSGSGMHQRAVYQFCKDYGRPFVPAKGFSQGRARFEPKSPRPGDTYGERWIIAKQETKEFGHLKLHEFDADYWKRFVHQRFLTPTVDEEGKFNPGAISLWEPSEPNYHRKFARQIAAEIWTEQFKPGRGIKAGWDKRSSKNHWLDSTAMACVGLSMAGVRVIGSVRKRSFKSMAEMQAQARK